MRQGYGWLIEGRGIVFTNYGHGAPGTLDDQVMLGADPAYQSGVVKIVRPNAAKRDKAKLTVVGRNKAGRRVLLREGWLKRNNLSREIRGDFAALTLMQPTALSVDGIISGREWYIVADLDAPIQEILARTADFALACARARSKAGGGKLKPADKKPYALAMDEKGKIFPVTRIAETKEICALQGYVYEALKVILGDDLTKPTQHGYAADGLIERTKLLIEVKTGVSPYDVYCAAGQLRLYPELIGLDEDLTPVLLIPDFPPMSPLLAAALNAANIEIYTYNCDHRQRRPRIIFSDTFLARCGCIPRTRRGTKVAARQ